MTQRMRLLGLVLALLCLAAILGGHAVAGPSSAPFATLSMGPTEAYARCLALTGQGSTAQALCPYEAFVRSVALTGQSSVGYAADGPSSAPFATLSMGPTEAEAYVRSLALAGQGSAAQAAEPDETFVRSVALMGRSSVGHAVAGPSSVPFGTLSMGPTEAEAYARSRALTSQISVGYAADEGVQVVSAFPAADGGLPEGLAIDKSGNMYVTVGYPFWFEVPEGFGEVWKISPDGEITVLDARPGGPSGAGLAVSPSGVLYYANPNPPNPDTNGVYRLDGEGERERLPGSENIVLANGLALNRQGDLYVSDSILGAVWRIPHDGGAAEIWAQHELLAGCEVGGFGANGVALWKDSMYVANTDMGLLARVPIFKDGTAGEPEIVAGDSDCDPDDELFGMDGLALDVHGNIYALLVLTNKLVRIDPVDGSHAVLLTADDGLFNPASIAFGTGKGDRQYVFMSNFALLEPGPPSNLGAGVLKYNVGTPGLPLP